MGEDPPKKSQVPPGGAKQTAVSNAPVGGAGPSKALSPLMLKRATFMSAIERIARLHERRHAEQHLRIYF